MQPFQTASDEFHSSIALDASTVDGVTVTVGVQTTRQDELEILETIYQYAAENGFKPFYDKANSLTREDDRAFIKGLINASRDHLIGYSHFHDGNAQTQQVEAVHGAIIVGDIYASGEKPLVLIDGGEQKAKPFLRAYSGLQPSLPPTAHCIKAELYYPAALLADLTANFMAARIARETYDYSDPLLRTPPAKQTRSAEWGPAYSAFYNNEISYDPVGLPHYRGETVRERIRCWFDGAVAPETASTPETDSISPIINYARENGYDTVATVLSGL